MIATVHGPYLSYFTNQYWIQDFQKGFNLSMPTLRSIEISESAKFLGMLSEVELSGVGEGGRGGGGGGAKVFGLTRL